MPDDKKGGFGATDTDKDTEGHAVRWSNRDLKEDIEPLADADDPTNEAKDELPDKDTEGHVARWSNRDLKEDIEPLADADKSPKPTREPDVESPAQG